MRRVPTIRISLQEYVCGVSSVEKKRNTQNLWQTKE